MKTNMMPAVLKFGGTSVKDATAMTRVVKIIEQRKNEHLVIVISAISEGTNILTYCTKTAANGDKTAAKKALDDLHQRHKQIIQEAIRSEQIQHEIHEKVDAFFQQANDLVTGLSFTHEFSLRILDWMVSFGELASSTIIVGIMEDRQLPGQWVDAREWLVTNKDFGRAEPDMPEICQRAGNIIYPLLESGQVPITQGYIGKSHDNIPTTLGREGSDFSAAILGNALNARQIEIWTDVDGILSADPRIVEKPIRVKTLNFAEAAELTLAGAKVLHPGTLVPAIEKQIPIQILNSFFPDHEGSLVTAHPQPDPDKNYPVTSITGKKALRIRTVAPPRHLPYSFFATIFNIFDKYNTAAEMVAITHLHISIAFCEGPDLAKLLDELNAFTPIETENNMAIITVVGQQIQQQEHVIDRLFGVYAGRDVKMINYGATGLSISVLVDEGKMIDYIQKIHQEFFAHV